MEKFPRLKIPDSNPYDQQARAFILSQQGQDLQRRYGAIPYEEENKVFETIAWLGSYLCNGISILTASTWVFSYAYSILMGLPTPHLVSGLITLSLLLVLEALQRYFTTKYFKLHYQLKLIKDGMRLYGGSLNSLMAGMGVCACISIGASFMGGFDFVKTVSSPPKYEAPVLTDVKLIEERYQKQINSAQDAVTDYTSKRVWKNRLSSQDAKKYQDLLDRKLGLGAEMLAEVKKAESTNDSLTATAKATYQQSMLDHENKTNTRGGGLGIVAVVFIICFYIAMWYQEYFKFRTVSQYAVLVHTEPETVNNVINIPSSGNDNMMFLMQDMMREIKGIKQDNNLISSPASNPSPTLSPASPSAGKTAQNPSVHSHEGNIGSSSTDTSVYTASQPCTWEIPKHLVTVIDKYTVPHRNFKTGELAHVNFQQINNRISDYAGRVEDAKTKNDNVALANRESKLIYWNEKMKELMQKANGQ